jgi:hypothetical protein
VTDRQERNLIAAKRRRKARQRRFAPFSNNGKMMALDQRYLAMSVRKK